MGAEKGRMIQARLGYRYWAKQKGERQESTGW